MKRLLTTMLCLLGIGAQAYTEQEAVAAVLVAEAGGEGYAGMRAVANVIQNRATASGTSRLVVINKRYQFSCLNAVTVESLIARSKNHSQWSTALSIASLRLADSTKGATMYHAKSVHPYWADASQKTVTIGNHIFYKRAR